MKSILYRCSYYILTMESMLMIVYNYCEDADQYHYTTTTTKLCIDCNDARRGANFGFRQI